MHRPFVAVVLTIMALAASACGSGDSESSPTSAESDSEEALEPAPTQAESVPDDGVDPDDLETWAADVGQLLNDYHEAELREQVEPPPDSAVLDRWIDEAQHAADVAQAAINAAPAPLGLAEVDAAYATLLAAFERERDAALAVVSAIEEGGPALEAEVIATPGATDTPLLVGTSLEALMTELLRPTAGRIDDACYELTDASIDLTDIVFDCVGAGAGVPDDLVPVPETTTFETPGVTVEVTGGEELSVRALTNGVQLRDSFPECVWVGRPAGVSDPAGPSGFDPTNVGAMIEVPGDLGLWVEAHPTLALLGEGVTAVAGLTGVPYWDIGIAGENVFFVFVDSDPPNGCFVLGFDDRARLHLIPHENGPALAITWLGGSPDPEEASSRLDELEVLLDAITVVA